VNLNFSSKASKQCRPALEELLFFNPRQSLVREGILNSLDQFGHPRLEEAGDNLSVRVGDQEAQTLFAYDEDLSTSDPVGVIVFLRTSPTEIAILHVAVHADYALRGRHGNLGLGITLVEKVKEIASRIRGVQRIVFFYRQEVVIRLRA
jgi:hypothetical protein